MSIVRSLGALVLLSITLVAHAKITPDVIYGHKDGMALTYDVIAADNPNGAGVLFMVSGGWFSSWRPPEERIAGGIKALLDAGFTIFAIHHGSAPRFKVPEAVSDVRAAVRHVHVHAADYGVDAKRLGVFGGSAGGHLSLMLGLNAEGPATQPAPPDSRPSTPSKTAQQPILQPLSPTSHQRISAILWAKTNASRHWIFQPNKHQPSRLS